MNKMWDCFLNEGTVKKGTEKKIKKMDKQICGSKEGK